ncbi:glutamine synthetase, partial [Chloroflexota bacterium]
GAVEVDVYKLQDDELRQRGIGKLPGSLGEAIDLMEGSELVKECLGEHLFNSFIRNKREEWDAYRAQVTEYELKKYLPIL